jgi:hypothetical protein
VRVGTQGGHPRIQSQISPALSLALIGSDSAQAREFWPKQKGDGPRHSR